jgi:Fe-Mn family superoxide dismutase
VNVINNRLGRKKSYESITKIDNIDLQEFSKKATGHFASGWAWLVLNKETGKVEIVDTHDADTVVKGDKYAPLLTCDVWEHAYYIDYKNARAKYLDAWWNIVNWKFANENLAKHK